jgi:hypothetical protein
MRGSGIMRINKSDTITCKILHGDKLIKSTIDSGYSSISQVISRTLFSLPKDLIKNYKENLVAEIYSEDKRLVKFYKIGKKYL